MSSRLSMLQGINSQPNEVLPGAQPTAPTSPADSAVSFYDQVATALDDAEAEVDEVADTKANPFAEKKFVRHFKIIHVPKRKLGKSYEEIVHTHLINPKHGSCYNRPKAFLLGLELGQDNLAKQKQVMHQIKIGLKSFLEIREGLIGTVQLALEACGDKNDLFLAGNGAAVVRGQHMLDKNREEWKEERAIEASRQNLKRRADEMQADNEETLQMSKRMKKHVDNGGCIMSDTPIDLNKNEGPQSAAIRKAIELKRAKQEAYLEDELQVIADYKLKIRETEARYKDLCRAHMLIYLELKREGWENIPVHYRRPGHWFA